MRPRLLPLMLAAMLAGGQAATAQRAHRRHDPAPASRAAPEKVFPYNATWVLQDIDGKPLPVSDPPSFMLDTTLRARGFGGCNAFSMAYYPVHHQTLASGAIAMTHKTCPPAVAALERQVLVTMHSEPKWAVLPDGDLTITAGRTVLRFRRGI